MDTGDMTAGRSTGWAIALGVTLIIVGTVAIMTPLFAAVLLMRVIGWLLIFAAIDQAVHAFRSQGEGGLFFKVLLAVLYAVVGAMLLRRPVSGAIAATAIIGLLFIADGIVEIALGLQLRRGYGKSEWLFAGGVLSLLFGGIILYRLPLRAVWLIGLLVGIRLIFKGIEQIVRSSPRVKPEIERRAA